MKIFCALFLILTLNTIHAREMQFGYYASALDGLGDFTDEIKDHSNIVNIGSYDINWSVDHIKMAKKKKIKVLLNVFHIFYDYQSYRLRPDYKARWADAVTKLQPYSDNIVAFYPIDEPDLVAISQNISQDDMRKSMELVATEIKMNYPKIPIAVIFGFGSITNDFVLAKNFDWFGFDCYDGFEKCGPLGRSITKVHNLLRQKIVTLNNSDNGLRKIILVPPSSFNKAIQADENAIVDLLKKYYELAWNDQMVVGIIPFIWQTLNEGTQTWVGTRELIKVQTYTKKILNSFTNNYHLPNASPVVTTGSNGSNDFVVTLVGNNFDTNAVVDVRLNNSSRTMMYTEINPTRSIIDQYRMTISFNLPSNLQDEFTKNGLYFHVVNHDFTTWSSGTLVKKASIAPAPAPAPVTPFISNAGPGCNANQCIWVLGKNFVSDSHIDLRLGDSTNKLLLSEYNVYHSTSANGQPSLSIEIKDPTILNYFKTPGLRVYVVNPTDKTWSNGYLVKKP